MKKKMGYFIYSIIGILFVLCCITVGELTSAGNIIWTGKWICKLCTISLIAGCILGCGIAFILYRMEAKPIRCTWLKKWKLPSPGIVFGVSWGLTMLCWLPGYLAFFPGIIAYDFLIQLEQMVNQAYNAHHPLIHTLFMEGCIRIGEAVGSGTWGLALYIFLQMGILAAAFAGGIALFRKWGVGTGWLVLLQTGACFMPSNVFMSVSATKDTLFTAMVLILTLMLCSMIGQGERGLKPGWKDFGYVLCTILAVMFRNNGMYAIMIMAVFLAAALVFGKKERKLWAKILGETVIGVTAGSILMMMLFNITGAVQGDKREMLSIPIQQIARTMVYHGGIGVVPEDDGGMEEADKALINEFILYEAYKNYRPDIADPVKGNTNTYVFVYRMKDFFKMYLNLLGKYPGDCINAVLAVNAGYLSPFDESHAYIYQQKEMVDLGYLQTRWIDPNVMGLERASKLPELLERLERFARENTYLRIPVLKYLMVPGTYLWVSLGMAAWLFLHKRYRLLIPFALILGYYVTLFLGPTVQMRYLYPIMTILPYVSIWALNIMDKEKAHR